MTDRLQFLPRRSGSGYTPTPPPPPRRPTGGGGGSRAATYGAMLEDTAELIESVLPVEDATLGAALTIQAEAIRDVLREDPCPT